MSLRTYALGAALVVVLGTSGCTPKGQPGDISVEEERATLLVENNNWQDMTLYILRDGVRSRLGSVSALGRSRFVLPTALIAGNGEIRLIADPLGSSQRWVSQPLFVMPGQQVRFRLENNVNLSTYSVW